MKRDDRHNGLDRRSAQHVFFASAAISKLRGKYKQQNKEKAAKRLLSGNLDI
jgi:hypothetical protein